MNPIRTNKPVFFGNNGEVLKNGYIYIGQPRQDPSVFANQKTVTFQDVGGTQFTGQQPLRTGVDGRIIYEATGKPIIALVTGDYSMLVQDENQVQIKNGYTPFVENATEGGLESAIYRDTLADLKTYNGTPGDYVENIGQLTTTDGDGARWVVVSNTGGPGDDVDLIDFDNGTQGVRVENQLYTNKLFSEIAAAGPAAQQTAKDNLGKIDTIDIEDGALSADIDGRAKMADGYVNGSKLASNSVDGSKIAPDSVAASEISFQLFTFTANLGVGVSNASFDIATEIGGPYGFPISLGLNSVSPTERDDHISVYFSDYFTSIPDSVVISRQNTTDALSVVVNIVSV